MIVINLDSSEMYSKVPQKVLTLGCQFIILQGLIGTLEGAGIVDICWGTSSKENEFFKVFFYMVSKCSMIPIHK